MDYCQILYSRCCLLFPRCHFSTSKHGYPFSKSSTYNVNSAGKNIHTSPKTEYNEAQYRIHSSPCCNLGIEHYHFQLLRSREQTQPLGRKCSLQNGIVKSAFIITFSTKNQDPIFARKTQNTTGTFFVRWKKYSEQLLLFLLSLYVIRHKVRLILLSRDLLFWIEIDTDICVVLLYNISTCSNDASIA